MELKRKNNIVFIVPSLVLGGHEFQTVEVINDYIDKYPENEIVILTSNEVFLEHLPKAVRPRVRLCSFPQGNIIFLLLQLWNTRKILKENISHEDIVIVSGGTVETVIYYSLIIRMLSLRAVECIGYIPMYVDKRLLRPRFGCLHNLVIDLASKLVDRYITINRIQAKIISHHFQRPVSVIRNRVTSYPLVELDFGPRLVYCGRLDDVQKNITSLIRLLDDPRNPYAELHIFGDGPAKNNVEDHVAACKHLTVVMHGWCSGNEMHQYLGLRDILVMNSRWEGEPLVVKEFLSRGIQVIVPDIFGFRGMGINKESKFTTKESLYEILNEKYNASLSHDYNI
ncbi:glycosyltransferase [Aeromonas caviae]|uniref:glycosyltransferase n=1 Tax=Aeromonas caviae TaxID=648 RepID=UPI0029DCC719|nr:glycosyltransferase [Aeromonas caviae]MDX7676380.1 glycosyltransferase [Aeromonas caviae]